MNEKLNRYAQLFKSEIVFIVESVSTLEEVASNFTRDTLWLDVTDFPNVKIGSKIALSPEGKITLTDPDNKLYLDKYMTSTSDAIEYAKLILRNKAKLLLDRIAVENYNCPCYCDMVADINSGDSVRRKNGLEIMEKKDKLYSFIDLYVISQEYKKFAFDFNKLLNLDISTIQEVYNIVYGKK